MTTATVHMAWECKPKRILDVGPGFGKYGLLIREYLPPVERLDCVEAWQPYTDQFPWLEKIYDQVIVGDVRDLGNEHLAAYDVVLMIDVIEHLEKDDGLALLERIPGWVIVCTPERFFQNPEADEIPTEKHRSLWSREDFGNRVDDDKSQLGGRVGEVEAVGREGKGSMSARNLQLATVNERDRRVRPEPEKHTRPESATLRAKDQEIENLKRLMSHVIQRLDALKTR